MVEKIISKLFADYLSEQTVATIPDYAQFAKQAFEKEKELRSQLNEQQIRCFEQLFELTSQIHFLEVKDAFCNACKLGVKISKEIIT